VTPTRTHNPDFDIAAVPLAQLNQQMKDLSAPQRVALALQTLPGAFALSSSFGAQAAVLLHMVSLQKADIPVVLVDTTYLFPETYQFITELTQRLKLNLVRVKPAKAWPEEKLAALSATDATLIAQYNQIHKVEPMWEALEDLQVRTWFAGLRRQQSSSRADIPFVQAIRQQLRDGSAIERLKVHPLADWSDRDVFRYLSHYQLPYHPLWEKGFVSIGDRYLTQALQPGMRAQDTRFFGVKRECGLHSESASF
jgi:phosphoadenosine phosphosulfate reductase